MANNMLTKSVAAAVQNDQLIFRCDPNRCIIADRSPGREAAYVPNKLNDRLIQEEEANAAAEKEGLFPNGLCTILLYPVEHAEGGVEIHRSDGLCFRKQSGAGPEAEGVAAA